MESFWTVISGFIDAILLKILNLLPNSPFVMLSSSPQIYKILQYMNWFIPVDFIISTTEAWAVAVAGYMIWQLVLRWLRAIE